MKNLRLLLLCCSLTLGGQSARGQISVGLTSAPGYFFTKEAPSFGGNGYPGQFVLEVGITGRMDLSRRFALGLSISHYQRSETLPCVYFPDGTEPLANANPLVNHPDYPCDTRSTTTIGYLDIPLSALYYFHRSADLSLYAGVGIGPQLELRRHTVVKDLLTDEVLDDSSYDTERPVLLSWQTAQLFLGMEKALTDQLALGGRLQFKTDELGFRDNTLGLGVYAIYRL
ncbi:MAG: hypothetical protein KDC54_13800 [Lewinella sp.]|nr:hypothetical protein [Lewinella sp.]